MPKVGPARPVKEERFVPGIHSVQGITSRIEHVKLRGVSFVAMIGDAIVEATLKRKIVGASELTLSVLDPSVGRRMLRSKLLEEAHELTLDGLRWKLVKVRNEGQNAPLVLTYEPLIVYLLKQLKGPHKAFRDLMTRAEFAQARAYEAKPRPRFIAPELHVVQDIATAEQGKEAKKRSEESRGKGIGNQPHLKINTDPATKSQLEIIDRMLRVAESLKAEGRVMLALIVALIDESVVGTLSDNLLQIEPASVSGFTGDPTNPEQSARGFLLGYNSSHEGAIEYFRKNPDAKFWEICQAVQRSGAGESSGGRANYAEHGDEAAAILKAYGGGAEVGTREFERYAFQQGPKESNWHCMVRLATEVRWRCFESAGWIYFLDEPTLLRSHHRMRVSDVAPGIIDTTFDYDVGKEVQQVTVEAQATAWAAPPGTVATVSRHGPADGIYIVETIESKPSSAKGLVNVTLKKPTEELPEPAPKSTSSSVNFSGGGGDLTGAPPKVQAIIDFIDRTDEAKTVYLWGGGHSSFASPTERMDCSGFVSAAVHAAGYLSVPLTSGEFANVFPNGEGEWVTIYGDAAHVLMKVKYPDGNWRWAETDPGNPGSGPGWVPESSAYTSGKTASHPPGL
jgi:hypothetical protein